MKVCIRCHKGKSVTEFYKNKLSKDGLCSHCKSCHYIGIKKSREKHPNKYTEQQNKHKNSKQRKKYEREYRGKNKEHIAEIGRIYRENNTEKEKDRKRKWREENIEKEKEYYANRKEVRQKYNIKYREKNKDLIAAYSKAYREKNRNEISKKLLEYHHNRYNYDPNYRIIKLLRGRINKFLFENNSHKNKKSEELIGCDWETAIKYLIGIGYKEGKHLDHIIPLSAFDVDNIEHRKIMFYYKNLQPLSPSENLRKGNRLPVNYNDILTCICCELLIDEEKISNYFRSLIKGESDYGYKIQ